ncbi:hypothetical protein JXA47_08615 [Candidatus Sumerlaeota bacterium]|nr:hypothetical protein [Candidatus Sumerlaeota bacterium]
MSAEPLSPPAELKGPIRPWTLFLRKRATETTAKIRMGIPAWCAAVALCSPFAVLVYAAHEMMHPASPFLVRPRLREDHWGLFLLAWILIEVSARPMGAMLAHFQVARWRAAQRLTEMRLSLLRPVDVGRVMLVRPFGTFGPVFLIAWIVLAMIWQHSHPGEWMLICALALLMMCTLVGLQTGAWAQLSLSLGFGGHLRPLWAMLNFHAVHGFLTAPIFIAMFVWLFVWLELQQTVQTGPMGYTFPPPGFLTLLVPLALIHWTIQMLSVRAHAAQFERHVFPRLEL